MSASLNRIATVARWWSLPTPFIALALCRYCQIWPWGVPAGRIDFAWHFGFFTSGIIGLIALAFSLARREIRWIWLPLAGLILTYHFAAETRIWQAIW